MAEIDIVPKHRSNLWIWLVVAAVVLMALWFLFMRSPAADRVGESRLTAPVPAAAAPARLQHFRAA